MTETNADFWADVEQHEKAAEFWLAHPLVRAYVNTKVSGRPDVWPMDWFRNSEFGNRPFEHVLSIGCGVGNLERELVRSGLVDHVEAIDLHESVISEARRLADLEGLGDRIHYAVGDADQYLQDRPDYFDIIFFHASLHHFANPKGTLRHCRDSLRSNGTLYVDEFVGPSMSEWRLVDLIFPNLVYRLLPRTTRRARLIRKPINPEDPSEAVCASQILPGIYESFVVVSRRDYGGNLLSLIYPNLQLPSDTRASGFFDQAIRFLIRLEEFLVHRFQHPIWSSFHTVIVATPKK